MSTATIQKNFAFFDTLKFSKRLQKAGFTKEQSDTLAEEQAEIIENKLATKFDLGLLENNLRKEIKEMELRLIIRLGTIVTVGIATVAVLVKFF